MVLTACHDALKTGSHYIFALCALTIDMEHIILQVRARGQYRVAAPKSSAGAGGERMLTTILRIRIHQ